MKQGGTQTELILAHFKTGASLTHLEALDLFASNRLAARVCELKAAGYNIQKEMIEVPSGKRVARYWLPLGRLDFFGQTKAPVNEMSTGTLEFARADTPVRRDASISQVG